MSRYAGIIVAAGRSSRMGLPKAELRLSSQDGSTVIERLVDVYRKAGLDPVLVVGPAQVLGAVRVEGDPDLPMIDSIARAIARLPGGVEGAIVQPVDAAYTTEAIIAELASGPSPRIARVPFHRGAPGHPVLVARALFGAILGRPNGGLRALLEAEGVDRVEVADATILADLDTPADVEEWEACAKGR